MELTVNGTPKDVELDEPTVRSLLAALGFPATRVAVEVNGSVIRRGAHDQHRLSGGDRVEIVTLVGGG